MPDIETVFVTFFPPHLFIALITLMLTWTAQPVCAGDIDGLFVPPMNFAEMEIVDEALAPIISPSLSQKKIMLTNLGQDDDILSRTPAPSTVVKPRPTPVSVRTERKHWEESMATISTAADSMIIRPDTVGSIKTAVEV